MGLNEAVEPAREAADAARGRAGLRGRAPHGRRRRRGRRGAPAAEAAAAGRPRSSTDELADHILIPSDAGEFKAKGLHGGHVTAHLMDFCAASAFHMREVANRDAGGTRWRLFEQWRWNERLSKKPTMPQRAAGRRRFDAKQWTLSDQPKCDRRRRLGLPARGRRRVALVVRPPQRRGGVRRRLRGDRRRARVRRAGRQGERALGRRRRVPGFFDPIVGGARVARSSPTRAGSRCPRS